MQRYLTPAQAANLLQVKEEDVMSLIENGKIRAIRIGDSIRIREAELERLEMTSPVVAGNSDATGLSNATEDENLPPGSRWCLTRSGRARFRVDGSVARGAEIWPGRMRYPIKFPKEFMDALRERFRGQEVPVGGKFDDPLPGSLGEFIQRELKIKMNPAVYLAALLIDERYAVTTRRGYIRFAVPIDDLLKSL
jgi:excisionase family DNA binding protein